MQSERDSRTPPLQQEPERGQAQACAVEYGCAPLRPLDLGSPLVGVSSSSGGGGASASDLRSALPDELTLSLWPGGGEGGVEERGTPPPESPWVSSQWTGEERAGLSDPTVCL